MTPERIKRTEIDRLFSNLKILTDAGFNCFEENFKIFASEYPDCNSISELNDIIEDEISYWEE